MTSRGTITVRRLRLAPCASEYANALPEVVGHRALVGQESLHFGASTVTSMKELGQISVNVTVIPPIHLTEDVPSGIPLARA